ncbi:MAG: TetR/AcrR family transcriptional regulator [Betaproteobacteria bacterium]|nr:MAG: TetR/AcrR family transcriptional regulator [Betaproteobacteria bacterium]
MSTSGPYHHGDLRPALLRAAGQLLEKQGLAALSLRETARRAGVSHNAPYRHFPDRGSLLAALATAGFAALGTAMQEAAAHGGLRAMGEAYVRFALERPQRFRLMFGGALPIAKHAALRESATRVFEGLAQALAPQLAGPAGRDASIAAWALVHGLSQLLLDERIASSALRGRERDEMVRAVLGSIRFAAAKPQTPA